MSDLPSYSRSSASVTRWIHELKEGNEQAAQQIWERYFARLAQMARRRLHDLPSPVIDEEDVALSVLDTLCRGVQAGRFPRLHDRDDLWSLLVAITRQKVATNKRRQHRQKRGGHGVRNESDLPSDAHGQEMALDQLPIGEPTPDMVAALEEQCGKMFNMLRDDTMREIAVAKLEGYSNREIAERLDISARTVQRKLKIIQQTWAEELRPT